jgi:hypothetical protein
MTDPTQNTAPDADKPEVPVDEDAPDDAPQVDETSDEGDDFTTFNLNEVPEEHKDYVTAAYNQLRGDYTRKRMSDAEERKQWEAEKTEFEEAQTSWQALQSDPEYQQQIYAALGEILQAEQAGEETEDLSPGELALARLEQLESYIEGQAESQDMQAQQDAELEHLSQQMSEIEKEADRELSENEIRILTSFAITNPDGEGRPDMKSAWITYQAAEAQNKLAYKQTKLATPAPSGVAVTNDLKPNTKEARVQQMADIINAEG